MNLEYIIEKRGMNYAEELRMVERFILDAHPAITSAVKYGLPFYLLKKGIFYLDIQKGKPLLGVVYGVHLESVSAILDFTGRKQIGHYSLVDLNEQKYQDIITIIDAGIEFDLR
jgi:hypothetical protein